MPGEGGEGRKGEDTMSRDFMTVSEAAEHIGMNARTLYALVGAKKIAHSRLGPSGGMIRISRADLDAYLDSCRVEAAGEKAPKVQARKAKAEPLVQKWDHFGWGKKQG